ncbi:MAG TPA: hypothetical protein PKO15_13320 [Fibrobacteria bacterium]|nr:hypothetical protein [Fibrobacteria bacterium]HOX52578.1 hypothetical protein [Fibrobacteria bacterium]
MPENQTQTTVDPQPPPAEEIVPRGVGWWQFLLSMVASVGIVGWGGPWILAKVRVSRLNALVALVGELRAGVGRYQADVGTVLPLDPSGQGVSRPSTSIAEPWTLPWVLTQEIPPSARGAWSRFRGPYLRRVRLENPPLGRDLRLDAAVVGTGRNQTPVPAFQPLALGGGSPVPQGHIAVWLTIDRVDRDDFLRLDELVDRFPRKGEAPEAHGEVLWSPRDGGMLQVLVLHR